MGESTVLLSTAEVDACMSHWSFCATGLRGFGGAVGQGNRHCAASPELQDHLNIRCPSVLLRGVYGRGLNTRVRSEEGVGLQTV